MYHNNMWSLVKWFQMMVIRGHHISVIEDHAFAGLDHLAQLNIFECDLTFMPPVSDVNDTLSELHLDSNDISYVPYGYFQGFEKLHRLSLADNLLTELPDFTDLTSTRRKLEVQSNMITHFPSWMLNTSMANWTTLQIYENIKSRGLFDIQRDLTMRHLIWYFMIWHILMPRNMMICYFLFTLFSCLK